MLSKRIRPDAFNFEVPVAKLMEVHSKGVDKGWLMKRAAMFDDIKDDIKPEKGHTLIHVITTGAMETYGANSNCDGFNRHSRSYTLPMPKRGSEATITLDGGLDKYHKTYMDKGYVYKNHKDNKNPDNASGTIIKEAMNDDLNRGELIISVDNDKWHDEIEKLANDEPVYLSQGCFIAGTLVSTLNGSRIPVEDVQAGDVVVNRKGKCVRVESTRVIKIKDGLFNRIHPAGGFTLTGTDYHPYSILREKDVINPSTKRYHKEVDVESKAVWVEAADVKPDDYLMTPIPSETHTPSYVNDEFARLCGYYLAEGYVTLSKNKEPDGICMTCNKKDTLYKDAENIGTALGYKVNIIPRRDCKEAADITIYDHKLAALFKELFGSGAKDKYIGSSVMAWDVSYQKIFMGAYHEGDGYFETGANKGRGRYNASFFTASRQLAMDSQLILARMGEPATLAIETNNYSAISKKTQLGYTLGYKVRCSKNFTAMFYPYSTKISEPPASFSTRGSKGHRKIYGNYLLSRVKENTQFIDTACVYNLHVADEDHSYLANDMAVHNCGVKYDICSICGHKRKSFKDSCDHIKMHKLAILDDGHQVFVINDAPHFHDISGVIKPADKIAFALRKVASGEVVTSVELAELEGYVAPSSLADSLYGKVFDKYSKLVKLAELEKEIIATGDDVAKGAFCDKSGFKDIDENTGDVINRDTDRSLGLMHGSKVVLPLELFMELMLKNSPDKDSSDELMPAVKDRMPTLFSDMLGSDDMDDILKDGTYDGMPGEHRHIKPLLDKMIGSHSMEFGPVKKRITITILNNGSDDVDKKLNLHKKSSEENSAADFVAKEYGKYLLSFNRVCDDEFAEKMSVLQKFV